ncbi:MAG: peptidoglycan DD-metalloendopeptidase family protein [Acidimicrobiia bacterium]|nr:peptidoglycan DD-metalloendopeptidase family protein [Acidimicrobiia bacterium]
MRRNAFILLLLFALVVSLSPAGAQSQSDISELEQQIDALSAKADAEKAQRSDAIVELEAARARMSVLNAELAVAQAKVDAVVAEIAMQEARLVEIDDLLDRLAREQAVTRFEIRESRQLVRDRAVEMYMERSMNFGGVFVNVSDVASVSIGLEYAGSVIESSEQLLNQLEVLERQEEAQQKEIEARQAEVERILVDLDANRVALEADKAVLDAKAAEVQVEVDAAAALVATINSAINELEGEISHLEADVQRMQAEINRRSTGSGSNPGILSWPLGGGVSSGFGYRIHPISGARKLHAGLDINGGSGQAISAAGSGTVILASWYGGYGNAIVIDHGGGLTTLYAHQSGFAVSEGQNVSTGQTIGYVGSTGYSTGPHLHFETREWGTPVDPMKYLGG